MNLKKIMALALTAVMSVGLLAGCGDSKDSNSSSKDNKEAKQVTVAIPDGLPAIALSKMIADNQEIDEGYKVNYIIEKTPENLSTAVMKGEADIAVVPSNMAAIAYNKTKEYEIAGTLGAGCLYLVSTEDITSYDQLKGKTIAMTGKGLTPDIITQSIFKDRGLNPAEVNFDYLNAASELVPTVASGKVNTAVVPEPALSALIQKQPVIKVIKNLNQEWKDINKTDMGYPQSTIIIKKNFNKENEKFVKDFLSDVKEDTEWDLENREELANDAAKIGITTEKSVIVNAMDRANIGFIPIKDSKKDYEDFYKKLNDVDPSLIGGALPDEGIFMAQ